MMLLDPDAEVIALSPKTLMATNRFVCEVCNKGFQREQNLQLHRRGHNLPWKLKQKSTKEVKRKVYLCPEPSCVHHDPARALGDLTGIKKHYSRKHGEKKYKCDKCSKKYAVHSDCKAHTKTCGTREYRCDCGTLFSRRDSFITHRAFCDALAQESARNLNPPPSLSSIGSHLLGLSQMSTPQEHHQMMNLHHHHHQPSNILRLGSTSSSRSQPQPAQPQPQQQPQQHGSSSRLDTFMFGSPTQPTSSRNMHQQPPNYEEGLFTNKPSSSSSSVLHGQLMQLPQLHVNNNVNGGGGTSSSSNAAGTSLFNLSFFPNNMANNSSSGEDHSNFFSSGNLMSVAIPSLYSTSPHAQQQNSPYMSATALLQKAAQLGSTTSNNNNPDTSNNSLLKAFGGNSNSSELHNQTAPSLNPDINFGGGSLVFGSESNNNNNRSHFHDLMMNSINAGSSSSIFENAYNTNGNHEQGNNIDDDDDDDEYGRGFGGGPTTVASFGRLTRDFLGVGEVMRRSTMDISSLDSQTGKSTTSSSFGGNFQ
ncbi:hypothetical protein ACJIZ3_019526 [Penstemon smallii]|uniref:C2H2-type domain-containing protein n=1 Tax=Penstemon smallii TaxID=265156 RepID=A0ABD3T1E8_9LAMI